MFLQYFVLCRLSRCLEEPLIQNYITTVAEMMRKSQPDASHHQQFSFLRIYEGIESHRKYLVESALLQLSMPVCLSGMTGSGVYFLRLHSSSSVYLSLESIYRLYTQVYQNPAKRLRDPGRFLPLGSHILSPFPQRFIAFRQLRIKLNDTFPVGLGATGIQNGIQKYIYIYIVQRCIYKDDKEASWLQQQNHVYESKNTRTEGNTKDCEFVQVTYA